MALLQPRRIIADEGIGGALRFAGNVIRNRDARQRVLGMRKTFRKYRDNLAAIEIVAVRNWIRWPTHPKRPSCTASPTPR